MKSYSQLSFRAINCSVQQDECRLIKDETTFSYSLLDGDKLIDIYNGPPDLNSLKNYCILKSRGRTARSVPASKAPADAEVFNPPHLTDVNFDDEIKINYTFVMFYAPWCKHCKRFKPFWNQLYERYKDNTTMRVKVVNCVAQSHLCNRLKVNGFPTMFMYKQGKNMGEYEGGKYLNQLEEFIARNMSEEAMSIWLEHEKEKNRKNAERKAAKAARLAADAQIADIEKTRKVRNSCNAKEEDHELCVPEWAKN